MAVIVVGVFLLITPFMVFITSSITAIYKHVCLQVKYTAPWRQEGDVSAASRSDASEQVRSLAWSSFACLVLHAKLYIAQETTISTSQLDASRQEPQSPDTANAETRRSSLC